MIEQADLSLQGDSSLGYGLRGSRHGMSFEKSEEEKSIREKNASIPEATIAREHIPLFPKHLNINL